ncbi:MAG: DUF1524 domain-containing protein [Gammaproteobacteria bacterium]|nr:DUF1524 domain-containing protein [Gammaproteobacteria bacterium]
MLVTELIQVLNNQSLSLNSSGVFRLCLCLVLSLTVGRVSADTWQGLNVEPENRCSPYHSKDYTYPQAVEPEIIRLIGKIYSPYTGRCFASRYETDIEHIVARSEAHDSGLCAASLAVRRKFASDLLNLTLASPYVNRNQKSHYDAAEWVPDLNQCWFAGRVIAVKRKYGLSVDRHEVAALQAILSRCDSFEMIVLECSGMTELAPTQPTLQQSISDPLAAWDDNKNGRITCKEALRHGIAPVYRDHPAYPFMRDADGDGVVCE